MAKLSSSNSYVLLDFNRIKTGDILPSDIFIKRADKYIKVVEANSTITDKLYKLLQLKDYLYVLDRNKENIHLKKVKTQEQTNVIDCNRLITNIQRESSDLTNTLRLLYDANSQVFNNFLNTEDNEIDIFCIKSIVESVIVLIQKNEHYLKQIMPHLQNENEFYIHSLNVLIYALHIGNALHFEKEKLLKLGEAALLHDIGEKKVLSLIDKESEFGAKELELIKKHTLTGIAILRQNNINDPFIIDAVLHHHERDDGSGYPHGLVKNKINEFSSILAVCDVFDALTIDRPYRQKYTTYESLKIMLSDLSMKNKFNKSYIKLLMV